MYLLIAPRMRNALSYNMWRKSALLSRVHRHFTLRVLNVDFMCSFKIAWTNTDMTLYCANCKIQLRKRP